MRRQNQRPPCNNRSRRRSSGLIERTCGSELEKPGSQPIQQVRARQREAALEASPTTGPQLLKIKDADCGAAPVGLSASVP
ncbi:hypothetical protein NDU88_006677 [Pleurodeles waltl]|uniref:Uncharacterized protein n=1 Tax=Pleurodeles waltl TaxID=8319 RepID=A0AAV7X291_PLEWA|nr:hypothetical protein NDU88_006677 [Pleurodeles waltl]